MDSTAAQTTHSKCALVTGASSGIGAAIVDKLLLEGWQVIGLSRSRPDIDHPGFQHLPLDLADAQALADALIKLPPVNAIVHAAGKLRVGEIGALNLADGQDMWRLHVEVATQLVNNLVPKMASGGRVVFIGSRTARGSAGRGQYAASKAAMVGLARSFAIELAPSGITVNVIAPGATDTPMLKDPARASVKPKLPPLGRLIQPGEIADLTAYLLSDSAASITGQEIIVCGGASL